jgi:ribosomal protein L11 methyltransferase
MPREKTAPLQAIRLRVPDWALPAYEAALEPLCHSVSLGLPEGEDAAWQIEALRDAAFPEARLEAALALAGAACGIAPDVERAEVEAEGWLARVYAGFPEQRVGRFVIRGSHLAGPRPASTILLRIDAGLAFGSGEHGSTRGCLLALQRLGGQPPRRILDLGTGSGILALATAARWRRPVRAVDVDPSSVRTAAANARDNRLHLLVSVRRSDGWRGVATGGVWNLVLANILARPLRAMARDLARHLAPGGRAVLAGFGPREVPAVLAAHRRQGLVLERMASESGWTTLVLRRPS